jgi:hypothetical protein
MDRRSDDISLITLGEVGPGTLKPVCLGIWVIYAYAFFCTHLWKYMPFRGKG